MKKKIVKKAKSNKQLLQQKLIEKNNKIFNALTPAQKRVTIAQDVLAQLDSKAIIATVGNWFNMTGEFNYDNTADTNNLSIKDKDIQDFISNKECEACGIGSLFVAAIKRCDNFKVNKLQSFTETINGGVFAEVQMEDIFKYLQRWFEKDQLKLIEQAFELGDGWFHDNKNKEAMAYFSDVPDPEARMRLIMKNIIHNKGRFNLKTKFKIKIVYELV